MFNGAEITQSAYSECANAITDTVVQPKSNESNSQLQTIYRILIFIIYHSTVNVALSLVHSLLYTTQ